MDKAVRIIVGEFVEECWNRVFTEVQDAAVYIDRAAAECLHWHTAGKGYLSLKAAGAIAVQELVMYSFHNIEIKNSKKAVIISTSNEPAFYQRTIKMIVAKNVFESCVIVSAAHSCSINQDPGIVPFERRIDYAKLKRDVKRWMSSKKIAQEPSVNIVHVPIFIALINDDLLVTPPFDHLMPPLESALTDELLVEADYFANTLHEFFERLCVKRDVYSMGKLSDYIAEKMGTFAASSYRPKANASEGSGMNVSLILVDRTLDLCTPTSNNTDSFLGKILRTLPHLPCHENDVSIGMSPICGELKGVSRVYETPGCLASLEKTTMDLLISKKSRKVLGAAHQSLNYLLSISTAKESPRPRAANRMTGHVLQKLLVKLKDAERFDATSADFREKLQMILAIVQASTSEKTAQLELLTSLEKLALQNLSVSRESSSILAQLSSIIRTRSTRGLDIENLLALLLHVYALAGTEIRFSEQQETALEESIADAVFEDAKRLSGNPPSGTPTFYQRTLLPLGVNDDTVPNDASKNIAARILNVLRAVAVQRSLLQDYRSLMIKPASQEMVRSVGVLEQLITHIFRTDSLQELRDLRQKSSSIVTTGFNLFARGRAKRHPRENPWLFIYVVGGVTSEEAKMVKEVVAAQQSDCHVTLAGSRLLSPLDIVDMILWSCIDQ